jgi:predicted transposase/invertase (TIGR01784 family)
VKGSSGRSHGAHGHSPDDRRRDVLRAVGSKSREHAIMADSMSDYSLLNDIIFKIVFGTDANRPLLRALLNALLGLQGPDRITDLTILNPSIDKEYLAQKDAILDVKAQDTRGRRYNIEVQLASRPAYVARAIFYLARLYTDQLEKGDPYSRLARTIGISLLDFVLIPELPDLHNRYRFYDEAHQRELTDILEIHFIELARFRGDKPRGLSTPFEKWLHALKFGEVFYGAQGTLIPEELREEEGIEMALEAMRKASASGEVREMIEFRRKAEHDEATRLEQARNEGRCETLRQTAQKMRDAGVDEETIWKVTGLRAGDGD